MFYLAKTPKWVTKLFGSSTWEMPDAEKNIYLTFDDGPHPEITPLVLDELDKFGAKATFFCIGKNVAENPSIYEDIIKRCHSIGNHTYQHLNGWKTEAKEYVNDILKAKEYINSDLFRPPYGRSTRKQHYELLHLNEPFHVIMWSVLSGDFDERISAKECCDNVIRNAGNGSIVVFHDSEKAKERMLYSLPRVLEYFLQRGYSFKRIDSKDLKKRTNL